MPVKRIETQPNSTRNKTIICYFDNMIKIIDSFNFVVILIESIFVMVTINKFKTD